MLRWDTDDGRYLSCRRLGRTLLIFNHCDTFCCSLSTSLSFRLPLRSWFKPKNTNSAHTWRRCMQTSDKPSWRGAGLCAGLDLDRFKSGVGCIFSYVLWISVQNRIETHFYFMHQGSSRAWSSNSTTVNGHRSAENHGGKMLQRFTDWWKISVRQRCSLVVSSGQYIHLNRSASSHTSVASGGTMTDCIRLHHRTM